MATGGDDTRVLVWPVLKGRDSLDRPSSADHRPLMIHTGHVSNIFCIQFDSSGHYLYSSGNDGFLLKFDIESTAAAAASQQGYTASTLVAAHEAACLRFSIDPANDDLVLTAGQDGCIRLWDLRVSSRDWQGEIRFRGHAQNYVEHNPAVPHLFLATNDRGGIHLYDTRMSFGVASPSSDHGTSSREPALIKYTTTRCRADCISRPSDISSAVWNQDGTAFCASIQRWYPTLYAAMNPDPICVFKTDAAVGQQYKSLATVKTGCFTQDETMGHEYVVAGSDDFCAYGWAVPPVDEMLDAQSARISSTLSTASAETNGSRDIMFYNKGTRISTHVVQAASFALCGHRSIVNSVAAHPTLPLIATSGVEKCFRLFAPFPLDADSSDSAEGIQQPTGRSRNAPSQRRRQMPPRSRGRGIDEDRAVLAYFDNLILEQSSRSVEAASWIKFRTPGRSGGGGSESSAGSSAEWESSDMSDQSDGSSNSSGSSDDDDGMHISGFDGIDE
ncbi:WD40-repeat-containing domain protein [Entophlyctis helioformis]|nr:WD40-repeat-containing domain protein [Entophlyctis helioformis]